MRKVQCCACVAAAVVAVACGGAAPADQAEAPPVADQEQAVSSEETVAEDAVAASEAIGTWIRQATYTNGELVGETPAMLVITDTTFSAESEACANSGALDLEADTMVMTVQQSSCPSIVNVGSVVTYGFTIEGDRMTVVNTEFGAEVSEVYLRRD